MRPYADVDPTRSLNRRRPNADAHQSSARGRSGNLEREAGFEAATPGWECDSEPEEER